MSVVKTQREANVCGKDPEAGQCLWLRLRGRPMSVVKTQREANVCGKDSEGGQCLW